MKKVINVVISYVNFFLFFICFFPNVVLAVDIEDTEPLRIRQLESIFMNVLIAIWALSIPYFMFVIGSIGFKWMTSFGDEQKVAALKTRAGNVVLSFAMVFGGFLVVKIIIGLLGFRDPNDCFKSQLGGNPIFQIFFPEACEP